MKNTNSKKSNLFSVVALMIPFAAKAQSGPEAPPTNAILNVIATLLPILVVAIIFFWFLKRIQNRTLAKADEYRNIHFAHMERVEKLLERIANAAEKNDKTLP